MRSVPKWKAFERDVHAIHAQYAHEGTSVRHDLKLEGFDSKVVRQIDVAIQGNLWGYAMFVAIECKDKNRPIDVGDISEFAMKVKDVHANKGVMISTSGYTQGAINAAHSYGLDALIFNKISGIELNGLRAFYFTAIKKDVKWAVRYRPLEEQTGAVINHHSMVYEENGTERGPISSLVDQQMNLGVIPGESGSYQIDFGTVFTMVDRKLIPTMMQIVVIIAVRHFIGSFRFERKKITDARTGVVVRDVIETPLISVRPWDSPQPEWSEVDSLPNLKVHALAELRSGPDWAFR